MEIILMHKDDLVAKLTFTDGGYFSKLDGFYNRDLMPPGTRVMDAMIEQRLKGWIENRCLPKERENYINLISEANVNTKEQLYFRNYGLSLNDCYWLRSIESMNSDISWKDVNYFTNQYSDHVGKILTDKSYRSYMNDFNSPDITTPGLSMKMWEQDPMTLKSSLIKFGTDKFDGEEVFIENVVSVIADCLGVDHVKYSLIEKQITDGYMCGCKCENFCTENIEFISAQALSVEPGNVGKNGMINYTKKVGQKHNLDKMLVLDYITCNPNRTFADFGFLRNADNHDLIGFAPIFDNGHALWLDYKTNGINENDECKPFDSMHSRQIEIVDDFSWIDFNRFDGLEFNMRQAFKGSSIPAEIQNKICQEVRNRVNSLYKIAREHHPLIPVSAQTKQNNDLNNKKNIILSQSSQGFGN